MTSGEAGDEPRRELAVALAEFVEDAPERLLRGPARSARVFELRRDGDRVGVVAPHPAAYEGDRLEVRGELVGIDVESGKGLPLLPLRHPLGPLERLHLLDVHQAGVVVLVARER